MEASYERGQGPEGAVASYLDGWMVRNVGLSGSTVGANVP